MHDHMMSFCHELLLFQQVSSRCLNAGRRLKFGGQRLACMQMESAVKFVAPSSMLCTQGCMRSAS